MYYINLFIFAILLSSCATTDESSTSSSSGLSPTIQSQEELSRYKQAITFLNNEQLEPAKEIFLEFKKERPELAGPYANLAVIELKNNNPAQAFELVKTALLRNSKLPQALNLLAYLEQINGDIRSAEKHYKEAIDNKDDYAIAHYNIALLYDIYLQDMTSAIKHYERYMELINNNDKNTADWLQQLKKTIEKG